MSISSSSDNQLLSQINVTPFVDVMLVLLIIFMVTAPMMIQGVKVALPEASSDPLPAGDDLLVISIDGKGQVFINDFKVATDFLQEKLARIIQNRKDRTVYLRADKNIAYGVVVGIMSEIKGAGVEKLGMVTEPSRNEKKTKGVRTRS
jgi:biopolymer transport protein TolR